MNMFKVSAITLGLFGASQLHADLFFSEYVEGSSFNKALEIYNPTNGTVDLSQYTIELYSNGNTSANATFALDGELAAGSVYVISHGSADPSILAIADATSSSTVNFNGDDAIVLRNGETVIDVIGQVGTDPGSQWGSGDASTQNNTIRRNTDITEGDDDATDAFDPSIEWTGFAVDTFDGLGTFDGTTDPSDPVDPEPPVATITPIYNIQGKSHQSPLVGTTVTTAGIVTAVDSRSFYIQDPQGDGNNKTSDGILIFTNATPTVSIGDAITVKGTVTEYIPGGANTNNLSITELTSPVVTVTSSDNPLPAAVVIGTSGLLPPTEIIDNDNFATFDPEEDGIDFYESLEGMRVTIEDAMAVSPTNRFNEIFVLNNQGVNATNVNNRSGITIDETEFNPERVQIQIDRDLLPNYSLDVSVGDLLGDVTGVVNYSFGNFEVLMTEEVTPTSAALEKETTDLISDEDHLTIASYNVLNLDPVVEQRELVNGTRDIDDDVGEGKFAAIADQIIINLNAPDIVALQEMQDSDGAQLTDVVDAELTAQTLINAIITAGGPQYAYAEIAPVNNADGGQPGGNIRVAYLYQPERVSLVENSLERIDGEAFTDSRKSLYAAFEFNGEIVHIINNHFSSKGGSSPLFGALQPFVNGRVENRDAQAALVNAFVDNLLAEDANANVVVLGDLNEFQFEQPLATLKGEEPVLTNLNETLAPTDIYTYIFQGNAQALDHILVSDALVNVSEYDIVHANAEFVDQVSDHDPLIVRLEIAKQPVTIDSIIITFNEYEFEELIQGTGTNRYVQAIRMIRFNYLLQEIKYAMMFGQTNRACRLIEKAIRKSDGVNNDWIMGEGTAELQSQLAELKANSCNIAN